MKTTKKTEYSDGRVWRCERDRNSLSFVILGKGSKPNTKICRVVDDVSPHHGCRERPAFKSEFTHSYLKKHAVLLTEAKASKLSETQEKMTAAHNEITKKFESINQTNLTAEDVALINSIEKVKDAVFEHNKVQRELLKSNKQVENEPNST